MGPAYLKDGWSSMDTEEVLQAIYSTGPFGGTGSALHSAVPVGALLALYRVFHIGRRDRRSILLWFLLGWLGHTVADFLTLVDDVRPPFWPSRTGRGLARSSTTAPTTAASSFSSVTV